jgi:hypothetical protein
LCSVTTPLSICPGMFANWTSESEGTIIHMKCLKIQRTVPISTYLVLYPNRKCLGLPLLPQTMWLVLYVCRHFGGIFHANFEEWDRNLTLFQLYRKPLHFILQYETCWMKSFKGWHLGYLVPLILNHVILPMAVD